MTFFFFHQLSILLPLNFSFVFLSFMIASASQLNAKLQLVFISAFSISFFFTGPSITPLNCKSCSSHRDVCCDYQDYYKPLLCMTRSPVGQSRSIFSRVSLIEDRLIAQSHIQVAQHYVSMHLLRFVFFGLFSYCLARMSTNFIKGASSSIRHYES